MVPIHKAWYERIYLKNICAIFNVKVLCHAVWTDWQMDNGCMTSCIAGLSNRTDYRLYPSATHMDQNWILDIFLAVAFTIRFSTEAPSIAEGGVFRFNTVPINIGNGYSPHSGIFTAPYSGIYVFLLNIMVKNNQGGVHVVITKADTAIGKLVSQWLNMGSKPSSEKLMIANNKLVLMYRKCSKVIITFIFHSEGNKNTDDMQHILIQSYMLKVSYLFSPAHPLQQKAMFLLCYTTQLNFPSQLFLCAPIAANDNPTKFHPGSLTPVQRKLGLLCFYLCCAVCSGFSTKFNAV